MPKKKKDDPSVTSAAYDLMTPRWDKMRTVLGGTEAMREAGDLYLPQHAEENDRRYQERLAAATLLNITELTLDSWVGRPFSEELITSEDMPDNVIDELLPNIDLEGNDLNVFCRSWFRDGLAKSLSHVLVDFPRVIGREDGQPRTLADDRQEKLRPYWNHLPPENVFFIHAMIQDGKEVLQQVRIMEEETFMDGFLEVTQRRIRILTPGQVTIFAEQKVRNKITWVKEDEWQTGIDFIPLVTFYANRTSLGMGKPPLIDLADLNINHWQSSSDQRAILTAARFPMLALSGGVDEDKKMTIGPWKWLYSPDPQSKYYYVEHKGAAIGAGRQDLMDLEEQMGQYGAEFLKKRPGNTTATARALDSAEATSPLQDVTKRFQDSVNLALDFTAKWLKIDHAGTIEITTDFGPETIENVDLDALKVARQNRDISREVFLNELKRRGVLDEDFDPEANDEALEKELEAFAASMKDLDPGAEEDDDPDDGNSNT